MTVQCVLSAVRNRSLYKTYVTFNLQTANLWSHLRGFTKTNCGTRVLIRGEITNLQRNNVCHEISYVYHIRLIFRCFYSGITGNETRNVDICFETPGFLKTGAVASWPDLSVGHSDRGNLQAMVGKSVHANTC
jgi:hypothetical protein